MYAPFVRIRLLYVFSTIAKLTDDNTAEYIAGMLEEDHSDDDTREFVCGILKEAMPNARAGAVICDRLFGLIDRIKKQQKQENVTIAAPLITSPPTKSTPNTNTIHTQQKDRQVTVISNNNTNKKKKKKKKK